MKNFTREPLLLGTILSLFGAVVAAILWQIDTREWLGVNVWVKPLKFFASIAMYLFTLQLLTSAVKGRETWVRKVRIFFALSMGIELVCINLQSARGVGSHFNVALPFDMYIYGIMGLFAFAQIPAIALLLYLFHKGASVAGPLASGVKWGLAIFLFGSIQAAHLGGSYGHTVGIPTQGLVIPFLGWSMEVGDLRVAHFFTLHSLQIFPLLGLLLTRFSLPSFLLWPPGLAYLSLIAFTWWQAVQGMAFIRA